VLSSMALGIDNELMEKRLLTIAEVVKYLSVPS
jgi:hypothetical protein